MSSAQAAKEVNGAVPSVAAGDTNVGPGATTATARQGKALAEHGRRPGRNASAGEASSSGAEVAGGQDAQVVHAHGVVSAAGRGGGFWPAWQSVLASGW